jgi:hypothetical protein
MKPDQIIDLITAATGTTFEDLRSPSRKREHVTPRMVAMYMMKEHTILSLTSIGWKFHRDHATALHAIRKVKTYIQMKDQEIIKIFKAIENEQNRRIVRKRAIVASNKKRVWPGSNIQKVRNTQVLRSLGAVDIYEGKSYKRPRITKIFCGSKQERN